MKYDDEPFSIDDLEHFNPTKDKAFCIIDAVEVKRSYSLLDFIRSGTEIVPIFAIDFTRSTGLRDAAIAAGNSLAHREPTDANDYAAIIDALGNVLQGYNANHSFP